LFITTIAKPYKVRTPLISVQSRVSQESGKDTFNDKRSQIAERKTGDEQGPGDRSKEAA
jgi:hypothetical protein